MAGIQEIGFGHLWDKIKQILAAIGNFVVSFFNDYGEIVGDIDRIKGSLEHTEQSIKDGIDKIKNFEFDVHWKTRVINIPIAIDHFRKTYDLIFSDFKERMHTIYEPIHDFVLIVEGEKTDVGDPNAPNALVRTSVKMHHVVVLISQLADALKEIEDYAEGFDRLITDIETLEDAFLQQSNPRKSFTKTGNFRV